MQRRIEGPDIAGRKVVVLEDTSTTGGSPIAAVEAAREVGAEVLGVAVIVDRATGRAGQDRGARGAVPLPVQPVRPRPGLTPWAVCWSPFVVPRRRRRCSCARVWLQRKRRERVPAVGARQRLDLPGVRPVAGRPLARGQPFGAGHAQRRATEVLRGAFDGHARAVLHLRVDHGQREEPDHAHQRTSSALGLPTYLPTVEVTPEGLGAELAKLVGRARTSSSSPRRSTSAFRVAASDERVGARDRAPAAHGAAAARRRARPRRGGSRARGSCRGRRAPPTSTGWRPARPARRGRPRRSRGTSGRTTATTRSTDALRSADLPDLREAML